MTVSQSPVEVGHDFPFFVAASLFCETFMHEHGQDTENSAFKKSVPAISALIQSLGLEICSKTFRDSIERRWRLLPQNTEYRSLADSGFSGA